MDTRSRAGFRDDVIVGQARPDHSLRQGGLVRVWPGGIENDRILCYILWQPNLILPERFSQGSDLLSLPKIIPEIRARFFQGGSEPSKIMEGFVD
ncbi:MAG: hypothetical protein H6Q48_3252 [Deltaproteobacteria bacterium]|nr:hypothetical protein [Deltaproteobacteria bacterium]